MSIAAVSKVSVPEALPDDRQAAVTGGNFARHCCRLCNHELQSVFVDLGTSPLCESFLSAEQLAQPEPFYPLTVYVCDKCFLVQLPAHVSGEHIFSEYAYFSSYSSSYLEHARLNAE